MAFVLKHQTVAEFMQRFWLLTRDLFNAGSGQTGAQRRTYMTEYARHIWWIAKRIQAGDITNTQARNSYNAAFGKSLTAAQWTTLVDTRFKPARDRYQAMLDEGALE